MSVLLTIAIKDLRLLLRNRAALFWTLAWPIAVAILFGLLFGSSGGGSSKPKVAIVLEETTAQAQSLVAALQREPAFEFDLLAREPAANAVRRGERSAAIVVPLGYAAASATTFAGKPPHVTLLIDPSRQAERAMLEGILMSVASRAMFSASDPLQAQARLERETAQLAQAPEGVREPMQRLFSALKDLPQMPATGIDGGFTPLTIDAESIARTRRGPSNSFSVTFPQGMLWGVLGALMSFAMTVVTERREGTLARLRAAPIPGWQVLAGKGLACFSAIVILLSLMLLIGSLGFGVRASSYPGFVLVTAGIAACFTGIMMLVSTLAKTQEGVSGAGWAIMMPLTMIGGGMVPLFLLPSWLNTVSVVSPVRWGIYGLEGVLWRQLPLLELLTPVAILVGIGALCFALGARRLSAAADAT